MRKIVFLLFFIILIPMISMGASVKWRSGKTGGGSTNLDGITGYSNGDPAIVWTGDEKYDYKFDSSETSGEFDPFIICPDDAGGDCSTGGWVLLKPVKKILVDEAKTSIACSDTGSVFTNDDSTGTKTFSITCECTAETEGWIASFMVVESGLAIRVDPHANDSICDMSDGEAGEYIQSDTTRGTAVVVMCIEEDQSGTEADAYNLITFGSNGTWSTED